jgi:MarR family transcriptional regulator, organic hydroperoxide resistance regulator
MPSKPVSRPAGAPRKAKAPRLRSAAGAASPRGRKGFAPPLTVSHRDLLTGGEDVAFRRSLYLMVLAFSRLQTCREAFGRALGLTGSQFAVLIGTAYQQHDDGVSVRALADHIQLAATHVTTEVGRLIAKGLLTKSVNRADRRGVLVRLSARGEAAVREVAPFVRRVNDLLFAGVTRKEFATVSAFLTRFAANSEEALDEIRRTARRAKSPTPGRSA